MSRRTELPPLPEPRVFEDDPALFDPSPEWFVPGLKHSLRENEEANDGLGLRSLIEQPESLSTAWRTTGRGSATRARRAKRRHSARVRRPSGPPSNSHEDDYADDGARVR